MNVLSTFNYVPIEKKTGTSTLTLNEVTGLPICSAKNIGFDAIFA